jgi:hypothetical protein
LTGKDPTAFDPADPLRLWIIQVGQFICPHLFLDDTPVFSFHALSGIIIITTQLLSLGLRKLRQPRVIAEVLGGILLGASFAPSCSFFNQSAV